MKTTHSHLLGICGNDCFIKEPKIRFELMGERERVRRRKGEGEKEEGGGREKLGVKGRERNGQNYKGLRFCTGGQRWIKILPSYPIVKFIFYRIYML